MAFERFSFSKSWENPEDFPSYEPDEKTVRKDLQCLHDETKDAVNALIEALNDPTAASNIPISVQGLEAQTVAQAVEQVYKAVRDAAAALIVDGSVSKQKLERELLERIYGGRVWVSAKVPSAEDGPDKDLPVGQLWLCPSVCVKNLVKEDWEVVGGTAEEENGGWCFVTDGSRDYLTASQLLQSVGQPGDLVLLHLQAEDPDGAWQQDLALIRRMCA